MIMSNPAIRGYEFTRNGKLENIDADSCEKTDDIPPRYIFRKAGRVVLEAFVHSLDSPPKEKLARTPEQNERLRESYRKAAEVDAMPPNLER
jgi:hypothetical protein